MDLQQIIDQLEQQAAQYREAANAMRTLQSQTGGSNDAPAPVEAAAPKAAPQRGAGKAKGKAKGSSAPKAKAAPAKAGNGGKRTVSPETRAKIAAAIKARHEQRRQSQDA
jgi:hypothetical protein